MRLHVGGPAVLVGAEELFDAVDGELLGLVDELAATVVAAARVALGVLVGELAALGHHHRGRGVVLARDQLDVLFLALVLLLDDGPQRGVGGLQGLLLVAEHGCFLGSCREIRTGMNLRFHRLEALC
ncbi:hypothetical protein D9M68_977460 [compost metagenome]